MTENERKKTTPEEFMAWAMKEKLQLSSESRKLLDSTVTDLFNKGLITKKTLDRYSSLTKSWARKIAQGE